MGLDLLTAMRVFTTVADAGSFAAAADRLELSRAMVTRYVAQLEAHLAVRLMHRTTRRMSLTEAGREYQRHVAQVLALVQESADAVGRHATAPTGTLRVASAVGFQRELQRAVSAFLFEQPGIRIELSLAERRIDLVEDGFDLAVRIGAAMEPGLVARRLARVRTVACASPAYLKRRGTPRSPQDLAGHNCLAYEHKDWGAEWLFRRGRATQAVAVSGNLRASGGTVLVGAALDGLGVILEPEFLVCDALRDGRLVSLLRGWQSVELALFAVYPERRHLPPKVRCFIDFLVKAFGGTPPWERWALEHVR